MSQSQEGYTRMSQERYVNNLTKTEFSSSGQYVESSNRYSSASVQQAEDVRTRVETYQLAGEELDSRRTDMRTIHDYAPVGTRKVGTGRVSSVQPVTFQRRVNPNQLLDMQYLEAPRQVQIIDKDVERIVETLRPTPVDKVVERTVERLQVVDNPTVKEVPYQQTVIRVEERIVEVPIDKEVIKEYVQEVVVDKVVERIVEIIKEVPVERYVQRRVEVIKEVPIVRYVDRLITKEIPVTQVVERVVEILKEVPTETIKEVPVYIKVDVSQYEARTQQSYSGSAQTQQYVAASAGVGLLLERNSDGAVYVRKLVPGGPAADCGQILVNDRLLFVDGVDVTPYSLDQIFDRINGEEGTPLTLEFARNYAGRDTQYSVTLNRKPAQGMRNSKAYGGQSQI
eukprot:CAMPEP_0173393426 /NCGR_PEP_ID=MMETSP1356-20130122/22101_1 /TAXON_ID=77927 ORGANISM="Hemiselmis virescens, Strain PCC157" /NCGR_SAMPLE_ID=MMETSP1356 /ASSEMBLY_ACC=CAM_ASM_000847 /LENGTH=396 /DNA_ID=CAMNT_0014351441 /DNA_START=79 /DNA_END=1269 /DNA_ORIENTATION=+